MDTIERVRSDDQYDLAMIMVRRDQLASAMPELAANRHIPTLLFMLNNPIGTNELIDELGNRVLLGFPGAGETRDGHVVRYAMLAQQPTMLGEPKGEETSRLRKVAEALRSSGFKTRTARDMDGWLKGHAFFVTAISGAIYLAGGNTQRLSKDDATLRLMVHGVREGFEAVRALGHIVTPFALRTLFLWLPAFFAVRYWRRLKQIWHGSALFGCSANRNRAIAEFHLMNPVFARWHLVRSRRQRRLHPGGKRRLGGGWDCSCAPGLSASDEMNSGLICRN